MRIDKLKEMEGKKRRGSTGRTLVQGIWLLIAIGLAYAFTEYVLFGGGYVTPNMLRNYFLLPAQVPVWAMKAAIIFLLVVAIQFFLFLGFAIANPRGRTRTGKPNAYSDDLDPFDNPYGH
jgi:hypothetical protein